MKDDAQFPQRIAADFPFPINAAYADLFNDVLDYALDNILVTGSDKRKERYTYWETLALLRGVMSSPVAGATMLRKKANKKQIISDEDEFGKEHEQSEKELVDAQAYADDNLPVVESASGSESALLQSFADRLDNLSGIERDNKAKEAIAAVRDWLKEGRSPVVFCRYIQTARYFGGLCKSRCCNVRPSPPA